MKSKFTDNVMNLLIYKLQILFNYNIWSKIFNKML